jgi:hypothetical protein
MIFVFWDLALGGHYLNMRRRFERKKEESASIFMAC